MILSRLATIEMGSFNFGLPEIAAVLWIFYLLFVPTRCDSSGASGQRAQGAFKEAFGMIRRPLSGLAKKMRRGLQGAAKRRGAQMVSHDWLPARQHGVAKD